MKSNRPTERPVGTGTLKIVQKARWCIKICNWLARKLPNPSPVTIFVVCKSVGKWVAGISGISIVIACSLVISSYAEFEATPGECSTRMFVSDAIRGGFRYACMFAVSGLLGLFASVIQLPNAIEVASAKSVMKWQNCLAFIATLFYVIFLLLAAMNIFHLSLKNLLGYENRVLHLCNLQNNS